MEKRTIKVGILDDHRAVIDGYAFKLQTAEDIHIVWSAEYYSQVEPFLEEHPTNCLLLDASVYNTPDDSNTYPILHAIPKLLDHYPDMVILVISMHNRRAFIKNIMQAGASGYIVKDDQDTYNQLPDIIRGVTAGDIYFSTSATPPIEEHPDEIPNLTPRQLESLSLKAANPDLTTLEMAQILHLNTSSIRNLLSSTYTRLGVRNCASAIAKAKNLGLITPD